MNTINFYQEQVDSQTMEEFVLQHRTLVKKIALHMKKRLPSHIDLDDLLQSGFIGLLEARGKYLVEKGVAFETFASTRIYGAMVDALRKNSWATRDALRSMRRISEAISLLEKRHQKHPTNEEIATEIGVDVDEYLRICQQITVCNVLNIDLVDVDSAGGADESSNPQEINQKQELISMIKQEITSLPEREQLVLSLYYLEDFNMKQIGEILDLTEARICQLHSQAISKLKSKCRARTKID